MKYLKTLTVAAVAATALMAFASTASATHLTVTVGTETVQAPAKSIVTSTLASGGEAILMSSFIGEVKCKESTFAGEIEKEGSATTTVSGPISTLTFTNCNARVVVERNGTLEVHTQESNNNGNGTLTSSGAKVTTELFGLHCIFETANTDIGTVKGTHEGHVLFEAKSAAIPRTGGRSGGFCGTTATWDATYTVINLEFPNKEHSFTNFTVV